ncbi:hypothetical protein [Aquidulcibacter sp.]|uniref:hypothetical protein n=1 Tax=Aquidulcibacter sp. TaxID=2052990 RepID=UPI0025B85C06|nr:hypothetical protein [Aquidulcibacter sp.]MCA3694405.1 hypothetical protein [Aquidulcibacter sp.]
MTEPVSHTAEVRKFLFFKDSRPIAPSIDDKINSAVQEMKEQVGGGFAGLSLLAIALNLDDLIKFQPSIDGWEFFLLAICVLASLGIFASLAQANSRDFQCGIQGKRTHVTSILSSAATLAMIWTFAAAAAGYVFTAQLEQLYETRGTALLVTALLTLLSALRAIQERIQWILDLRAEQGQVSAQRADGEAASPKSGPAWFQRPTN